MRFSQGNFTGSLKLVTIDHSTCRNNKILWTTKQVLMLVDDHGLILCTAQFRSNAFKKAEKFLVSLGWNVTK